MACDRLLELCLLLLGVVTCACSCWNCSTFILSTVLSTFLNCCMCSSECLTLFSISSSCLASSYSSCIMYLILFWLSIFSFSFFFFRSLLLVSFIFTFVDGILVFWVVRFVLVLWFLGFFVCYLVGSILLFFLFSRRFASWIVSGAGCCVVSWLSLVICCGLLISSLLFGFARFFSLRKTLDRRSTASLLVAFVAAATLWAFCRPRGWCWGWV